MSILAFLLVLVGVTALLVAIAIQLDIAEARYQERLDERIREWDANERGSAKVIDFEEWCRRRENARGVA